MPVNQYNKIRMDQLRSSQGQWSTVKQVLVEQMVSVQILKAFYNTWINDIKEKHMSSSDAYRDAVSRLPKDKPNTPYNEEVTEAQIHEWAEDTFKKPFNQIFESDVNSKLNDVKALTGKIHDLLGRTFSADEQVKSLDEDIDDLNAVMKAESATI